MQRGSHSPPLLMYMRVELKKNNRILNFIGAEIVFILCLALFAIFLVNIDHYYRELRMERAIGSGQASGSRIVELLDDGVYCADVINIMCHDEWPDINKIDMVSNHFIDDSSDVIRSVIIYEGDNLESIYPMERYSPELDPLLKEGGALYKDAVFAKENGIQHISNSFGLLSGDKAFAIIQPVPDDDRNEGDKHYTGVAVVILDVNMLLEKAGVFDLKDQNYNYMLYKTDEATDETETLASFGLEYLKDPVKVDKVMPNGEVWHFLISMNGGWTTAAERAFCCIVVILMSVLIAFIVHLFLRLNSREKELKNLSYSDSLTKLKNTRAYSDALEELKDNDEEYGIVFIDVNGFKRINDTYGHRTGDEILHITAERIGNTIRQDDVIYRIGGDEFAVIIHGAHDEDFYNDVIHRMKEAMIRKVSIQDYTLHVSISCGFARYPYDGTDPHSVVQVADTEMYKDKAAQKTGDTKTYYWFNHDGLTGLLNRDGFYKAVALYLSEHEESEHVMICTDIRNFKIINQLYGTGKGNEIIIKEARLLSKEYAENGILCARISGDRFAILMDEAVFDEEEISNIMKDFQKTAMGDSYRMIIQLGVYRVSDTDLSPAIMLDKTEMALKSVHSDREFELIYYSDDMVTDTLLENEVLNKFDNALKNNEFVMYLQHQVDRDGNLLGAEALARWISGGKVVSPADFIPVLEKTNQIYKLDNFIWEEAAKRLSTWKGTPLEKLSISVNISPKDIYNIDIEKKFNELRSKYDIDPGSLKLEITETAVMLDRTDGSRLVDRLKELGFEVEMDDFGSGYSSLNMLKDIKIDVLKIDMGFLNETDDEKRAAVIIDSVISMAKKLGMTVIAEGVEKKEQVEFLSEMGCDVFQGYYFSKPMPVEDFEKEVTQQ